MKKALLIYCVLLVLLLNNSCELPEGPLNKNPEQVEIKYDSIVDSRDGQTYKTVQIGEQVWMAENLKYISEYGYYLYDDNPEKGEVYGGLYNWYTACDVCPDGWHLPSDAEWIQLEIFLGMNESEADSIGIRATGVGGKLKDIGTEYWHSPNEGATNETGFSALPGGRKKLSSYMSEGYGASFWTSTFSSNSNLVACFRSLNYRYTEILRSYEDKLDNLSVRCVKD